MGKHFKQSNNHINIIRALFIILLIISIVNIIKWYIENKENEQIQENISEAIKIEDNSKEEYTQYKIDFEKLKKTNKDIVAWIKVNGTDIEYPIVQAKDNSYYLNHNLEKKYNKAGWIFADYRNKLDGTDKNIIIYGHNRKDDSMFGTLKNALKQEWYKNKENLKIDFITEQEQQQYEVFSVYEIESEEYYIKTDFENNQFIDFIDTLKSRSIKKFNVEITENDQILTLSTCANNNKGRVVLHAKK